MTREQKEQLEEAAEHLAQARAIFTELAESVGSLDEENPDDDSDDVSIQADLENFIAAIEEIEGGIEDLSEAW